MGNQRDQAVRVALTGEVSSSVDLMTTGVPERGRVAEVVPPRRDDEQRSIRHRLHSRSQTVGTSRHRLRVSPRTNELELFR
jgi:hypothetical protein